jgi:hypothetical protein
MMMMVFFKCYSSDDKYIGFLNSKSMYDAEIKMNLNTCTKQNEEMFFVWDHNPTSTTDTTTEPVPTSIVSNCPFENLGFPCCTDSNTKVSTTDEYGSWG